MQKCIFMPLAMTRDSVENGSGRLESGLSPELRSFPKVCGWAGSEPGPAPPLNLCLILRLDQRRPLAIRVHRDPRSARRSQARVTLEARGWKFGDF